MKELSEYHVESRKINPFNYKNRSAKEEDISNDFLINDSVVIIENNKPILIYLNNFIQDEMLFKALQRIDYYKTDRTRGLISNSRIFGYSPRITHRKDFCSTAALAEDHPYENDIVCNYAKRVEAIYKDYAPDVWKGHSEQAKKVLIKYKLPESIYTSGIINKNNPLNYHFDSGNFPNTFSSMIVFKKDIEGGHLNLPAYNLKLECGNGSLVIFNGEGILHGVTPIVKKSLNAERFSIVYYSLKGLWNCLNPTDELDRIRKRKAKREHDRYLMSTGQKIPEKSLQDQLDRLEARKK